MRNKLGVLLMCLGLLMLAGAGGLLYHNHSSDEAAGEASAALLPLVEEEIVRREGERPAVSAEPVPEPMPVAVVDSRTYIGILTLPKADRELPVLADWSYPGLKKAPCRYSGTALTDDLVILGHNNRRHFGPVARMEPGDPVIFTNADGVTQRYKVGQVEQLMPYETERLTGGEADLTLVTCTYSGQKRIAVRCDRVLTEN